MQPAAEHAARVEQLAQQCLGSGENRSARGVEVLVEGNVDSVEQRGVLAHRTIAIGALEKQTRAVEMQADALSARPGRDLLHLVEIERFAAAASHRTLDLNRPDRAGDAA